jgi:hypothetical protein
VKRISYAEFWERIGARRARADRLRIRYKFLNVHLRFTVATENELAIGCASPRGAKLSETSMKNILSAALAVVALGIASLAPTAPARADSAGAAVAAGIGGLAVGTIVGGALARPAPPVYYPAPAPVYVEPHCWRERRPVFDEYGEVIGYRPQRVCE